MEGWIKLHRKILDNPIVCKDSDHIAVWTYLLLNATHKEYSVVFSGEKIMLQPGQLITGRKVISEKFKISESKVQRILKSFEIEQQIEQQNGNKNRLVSILSWSDYQTGEQQDEQQVNNKRTTTEQQVNTNKNVKNVKNVKNDKKEKINSPKQVYDESSLPFRTANYLYNNILKHKPDLKQPNLQTWANDMRKLIEIDKRDPAEIGKVIEWVTNDPFWQANILSALKLREKWDTLTMQMNSKKVSSFPNQYKSKADKDAEEIERLKQKISGGMTLEDINRTGSIIDITPNQNSLSQLRLEL